MDPLFFNEFRLQQFEAILAIGADELRSIESDLSKKDSDELLIADDFIDLVSQNYGALVARSLYASLASLYSFLKRNPTSSGTLGGALSNGLKEAGWNEQYLQSWDSIKEQLISLLFSISFRKLITNTEACYSSQNTLGDARISAVTRPVFDIDGIGVGGFIITSELQIYFSDGERSQSVNVVLEENEVEALLSAAAQALKEMNALRRLFKEKRIRTRTFRASRVTDASS